MIRGLKADCRWIANYFRVQVENFLSFLADYARKTDLDEISTIQNAILVMVGALVLWNF